MAIVTKELTPALWPALEELFGRNGACGGCWCQAWRIEAGERMPDIQGPTAKRRFKKQVREREALGVLAFAGDRAVGWCAFGPRTGFPRLARARTLACDDAARVWSLPCFFVRRGYRGQGVAGALLAHALRSLARRGVEIAEGYPARQYGKDGIPAAFAWTGTVPLFRAQGFSPVGHRGGAKQRMRRKLRVIG